MTLPSVRALLKQELKHLDHDNSKMIRTFKGQVSSVSRDLWICDPEHGHKEGKMTFSGSN